MYMLWLFVWWFGGTPNSENGCVSDSFTCSWDAFPPIVAFSSLDMKTFAFLIISCFLLFACYVLEASFLTEKQGESDSG